MLPDVSQVGRCFLGADRPVMSVHRPASASHQRRKHGVTRQILSQHDRSVAALIETSAVGGRARFCRPGTH
jgi:hypothetical protein